MIPFDFEYYRPDTAMDAVDLFGRLESEGKNPVYYGGGSELISMARVGNLTYGAVIDLKGIPESRRIESVGEYLYLGSMLTLSELCEANPFPLLTKCAGRIADHTMQCKITLGGNLASAIYYRETALSLFVSDAFVTACGPEGIRRIPFTNVFGDGLRLKKGEFILSVEVEKRFLSAPYFHVKKTRNEKIDYPLLTASGLKIDGKLRLALSGLCPFPFRNKDAEIVLNDGGLGFEARAEKISALLSGIIFSDFYGSAEFRKYVLKNTICNILSVMKDCE
ncbi:hypothetical protein SDC9_67184 [bioreactor metagenome]|uniref:FAD-binding PCMH-type domain-containing protein n=1 Tax=bioreactor metagenome TaxID=1076179 RepID=A0A644XY83_9ZZZZ